MPNTITGTSQNDKLSGTTGDDVINALGGFDTVTDFGGNDTISGGDDADLLIYITDNVGVKVDLARRTAQDTGGGGIDTLSSFEHVFAQTGRGNDTIFGTKDSNRIQTGLGDDTIDGRAGSDLIITGDGTKIIDGGDGFDIYQYQSAKVGGIYQGVTLSLALQGTAQVSGGLTMTLSNVEALGGGRGDDVLTGDDNGNVLDGGLGNDEIHGGGANDLITGDGSYGTYSVTFSLFHTDNPKTGGSNDKLYGDAGDDYIHGGRGNDLLDGGDGNDRLFGEAGTNTLIGGAGDDQYFDVTASDTITEAADGGTDTVRTAISYTLGDNVENLIMGGKAITGTGNAEANSITGTSLANVIDGGAGADIMIGGLGNDTYYVDNVVDIVTDWGSGKDQIFASVDYTLSANVEKLILTGAAMVGNGNAQANTLIGTGADNVLNGGGGADSLIGGEGNDTYYVNVVNDKVVELEGGGTDTVQSSAAAYTLGANVENLTLLTGGVAATGNTLDNVLTGNEGANLLDGKRGADTMSGGLGNDTYAVDGAADTVIENAGGGTDSVNSAVNYTLGANLENLVLNGSARSGTGNELANTITGTAAANTLDGQAGNDTLNGGAGDDKLIGGAGIDTLNGGIGADHFIFLAAADSGTGGAKPDLIGDFGSAEGDKIDLGQIDANGSADGDGAFRLITAFDGAAGALTVVAKSGNWLVRGDVDGDKVADFAILVHSASAPIATDFIL